MIYQNNGTLTTLRNIFYFSFSIAYISKTFLSYQFLAYSKIIPLILLIWELQVNIKKQPYIIKIEIGVIFGAIGDIILQHFDQSLFVFGALSFFVGHLFYIYSFMQIEQKMIKIHSNYYFLRKKIGIAVFSALIIIISMINVATINNDQFKDKYSIMVYLLPCYAASLSISCITAFHLLMISFGPKKYNNMALISILFGTILFYASDNILAQSKFTNNLSNHKISSVIIMTTYYLGQFLTSKGAIKCCKDYIAQNSQNRQTLATEETLQY